MTDANLRNRRWTPRAILTVAILLAASFTGGFLWQYIEARTARGEVTELQEELDFQRMATTLAAAVIQAENQGYEGARELMSRFFTDLQARIDEAEPEVRSDLEALLSRRDAVITALSRSQPGSAADLTRMFVRFRVALGGPEVGIPLPPIQTSETPVPEGTEPAVPPAAGADTADAPVDTLDTPDTLVPDTAGGSGPPGPELD